jgi:hypothetical protein
MRLCACAFILAVLACACATGCRPSDALTDVIYDQTSQNIDYNSPDKFRINDTSSNVKDPSIPSSEVDDKGQITKDKQNIVVYSSKPNAPQYSAKKSVWDPKPDFSGIEASESVSFYESDSKDATEQDIKKQEEKQDDEQQATTQTNVVSSKSSDNGSGGSGDNTKKEGKKKSPEGKKKTTKKAKGGGGKKDDTPKKEETKSKEGDDKELEATPPTSAGKGKMYKLPKVSRIAAYGQAAVMVQMSGGQGALVAADKKLLESEFSNVFADEGASDIAIGWKDGGSAEKIDVDAILKSKAQLLIVDDDEYMENLSKSDKKKINKSLKSKDKDSLQEVVSLGLEDTEDLKKMAKKVGDGLSEATGIGNAGKTTDIASDYQDWHDDLVKTCADNNGGLAYDSFNEDTTVYELGDDSFAKKLSKNSDGKFTLLIDAWDSSVKYTNTDSWVPDTKGIALSRIGFDGTPVSYYIQAGGLVNNAAARGSANNPGLYPVWQYASLTLVKKNFSYEAGGYFDLSSAKSSKRDGSTSWDPILLTTNHNRVQNGTGLSFGTTLFPRLIAATQHIKEKVMAASVDESQIYHPYEAQEDDVRGTNVYETDGDQVLACIGVTGSTNESSRTIGTEISDDEIVVNPHGLFSSWTEGTTVEGALEAAWVNDIANGENATVGWKDYVKDFYQTFYRYDEFSSSDMDTIEAGLDK